MAVSATAVRAAPPEHGQHTGEVLDAIGIDAAEPAELRERGAVR